MCEILHFLKGKVAAPISTQRPLDLELFNLRYRIVSSVDFKELKRYTFAEQLAWKK